MQQFSATVVDPIGIHARPAALVVMAASKFQSEVKIKSNNREGNLKSIMNTLAMAIKCNQDFTVTATGEDEVACIEHIKTVMQENKIIK